MLTTFRFPDLAAHLTIGVGGVEVPFTTMLFICAAVYVALFIWWARMLIEALAIPSLLWADAGYNRANYLLAMFFLGWFGTLLYVLIPRKFLTT